MRAPGLYQQGVVAGKSHVTAPNATLKAVLLLYSLLNPMHTIEPTSTLRVNLNFDTAFM